MILDSHAQFNLKARNIELDQNICVNFSTEYQAISYYLLNSITIINNSL